MAVTRVHPVPLPKSEVRTEKSPFAHSNSNLLRREGRRLASSPLKEAERLNPNLAASIGAWRSPLTANVMPAALANRKELPLEISLGHGGCLRRCPCACVGRGLPPAGVEDDGGEGTWQDRPWRFGMGLYFQLTSYVWRPTVSFGPNNSGRLFLCGFEPALTHFL